MWKSQKDLNAVLLQGPTLTSNVQCSFHYLYRGITFLIQVTLDEAAFMCTFCKLPLFFKIDFVHKWLHIYIWYDCYYSWTRWEIKNRHSGLVFHSYLLSLLHFSFKVRSCTSCLSFKFKHSADSNACEKENSNKNKKGRGDHNQKYVHKGQSMYRRYQAPAASSSEWIP